MDKTVFDFQDYKLYLNTLIEGKPSKGRGFRAQLADGIGIQRAFLSQVLQRDAHFNLEHGEKINHVLMHTPEEAHFFLLLIQYARAGTEGLRRYFRNQMKAALSHRTTLKNRLKTDHRLSEDDQRTYYSAWYYGAVRVAISIPKLQTIDALVKRLELSPSKVKTVLEFLVSRGLATRIGEKYVPGKLQMHLGNESAMISKHHLNWRMRAIHAIEDDKPNDLHYSYVASVSEEDAVQIKALIVNYIEEVQKRIIPSKEETLFTFCVDYFEI